MGKTILIALVLCYLWWGGSTASGSKPKRSRKHQ
jgi:hypothetical protein